MQIDANLEEVNLLPLLSNQTKSMSGQLLNNNKPVGSDGFSVEFYKVFSK